MVNASDSETTEVVDGDAPTEVDSDAPTEVVDGGSLVADAAMEAPLAPGRTAAVSAREVAAMDSGALRLRRRILDDGRRILDDDTDGSNSATSSAPSCPDTLASPVPRRFHTLWQNALEDAVWNALPLIFEYTLEACLEARMADLVASVAECYVGGTAAPGRRWLGGPTPRGQMAGHREQWDVMHVVHIASGRRAAALEQRLIVWAMASQPAKCRNRAPDARGLSTSHPNFIYMVSRCARRRS